MQRVWCDPQENDFFDPPEFDRSAAKAYHDALPQWLRDRMHMQDLARSAPPTEATRLWRLEIRQWLRLRTRTLRPVRLRPWLYQLYRHEQDDY